MVKVVDTDAIHKAIAEVAYLLPFSKDKWHCIEFWAKVSSETGVVYVDGIRIILESTPPKIRVSRRQRFMQLWKGV
jgi:hypothetical protein